METWTGFLRIQVMMAYNQCLGITLMQLFNQFSQRSLLCFRPGVFRRCSAIIQSAYVAYTYTVAVVVLAMCSNQLFRASGFYREEEVHDQQGVGIGLYLAREIVTRQGGYIKVVSELRQGSEFSIMLPVR